MTEVVDGKIESEAEIKPLVFCMTNQTVLDEISKTIVSWNKDELTEAIKATVARYEGVVYTADDIKQAKADRAELNKLAKSLEDKRKEVKSMLTQPYHMFEYDIKKIIDLIKQPTQMIDKQIKAYEQSQKDDKKEKLEKFFCENVDKYGVAEWISFDDVFEERYLNTTYAFSKATEDIAAKLQKVQTEMDIILGLEDKYVAAVQAAYLKTFHLELALSEHKRLKEMDEKLEAERKRKEAEEAARQEAEKAKEKKPDSVEVVASVPVEKEEPEVTQKPISADTEDAEPKEKIYNAAFTAYGTKEQLQALAAFMRNNGIKFKPIKNQPESTVA